MIDRYLYQGLADPGLLAQYSSHAFISQGLVDEAHQFRGIKTFGPAPRNGEFMLNRPSRLAGFTYALATDVHLDQFGTLYHRQEAEAHPGLVGLDGFSCYLSKPGDNVIGHWLLEHLPRAFFVSHALQGVPVRFLLHKRAKKMFGLFQPFLSRLPGFNGVHYLGATPARLDGLVYSDVFARGNKLVGSVYGDFRRWLLAEWAAVQQGRPKPAATPEKLFLSRGQWKAGSRRLANRGEVEALFAEAGFAVVHPEDYPLLELLAMMAGCKVLAGERGSALHLSVFCRAVTSVIVLSYQDDPNGMWPAQAGLGTAIGQGTVFVFGPGRQLGGQRNDFEYRLCPDDVKDAIAAC